MRTIKTNVYLFNELTESAKQKAIEKMWDVNGYYGWWESIYEDAESIGLKITEFDLDRRRYAKGEFLLSACEVAQNVLNEHGENCETHKTAQSFLNEWQPVFNSYMDESSPDYESSDLEDQLNSLEDDFKKSLLEDYSIILQKESEYLQSHEAIVESIIANEYEFTEDGELF